MREELNLKLNMAYFACSAAVQNENSVVFFSPQANYTDRATQPAGEFSANFSW
jgi:hypothetical protein